MTSRRKGHACMAWNAFVFRGNLASLALAQCPLTILLYGHEVSCRAAGVVGGTVHHTSPHHWRLCRTCVCLGRRWCVSCDMKEQHVTDHSAYRKDQVFQRLDSNILKRLVGESCWAELFSWWLAGAGVLPLAVYLVGL